MLSDYDAIANLTNEELLALKVACGTNESYLSAYLGRRLPGTYLVYEGWRGDRYKGGNKLHTVRCLCGNYLTSQASDLVYQQSQVARGKHSIGTRTCSKGCKYSLETAKASLQANLQALSAKSQDTYETLQSYLPNRANYSLVSWEPGKVVNGKIVKTTVTMLTNDGKEVTAQMGHKLDQLSGRQAIKSAVRRAKQQNRQVDIDYLTNWVNTLWRPGNQLICGYTGLPLTYLAKGEHSLTPSIDKVVPDLGYMPGNLVLCSKLANTLKSKHNLTELRRLLNTRNTVYLKTLIAIIDYLETNPHHEKVYSLPGYDW